MKLNYITINDLIYIGLTGYDKYIMIDTKYGYDLYQVARGISTLLNNLKDTIIADYKFTSVDNPLINRTRNNLLSECEIRFFLEDNGVLATYNDFQTRSKIIFTLDNKEDITNFDVLKKLCIETAAVVKDTCRELDKNIKIKTGEIL